MDKSSVFEHPAQHSTAQHGTAQHSTPKSVLALAAAAQLDNPVCNKSRLSNSVCSSMSHSVCSLSCSVLQPELIQCVGRLKNEEVLLMKSKRMGSGDVSKPGRPSPRAGSSGRGDPTRPRRSTSDASGPSPLSITNLSSSSTSRYGVATTPVLHLEPHPGYAQLVKSCLGMRPTLGSHPRPPRIH